MDVQTYLKKVKEKLMFSMKIRSVKITDERIVLSNHGYFRARLVLSNNDFPEVSEYFMCDGNRCSPLKYRHQWMDGSFTRLIKRWDNVNHFPNLPGYPHHVHVGSEDNVFPSKPLGIIDVIRIIEKEIE